MKVIILIIFISLFFLYACFFPKGVKIFGIRAEEFFSEEKSDEKNTD